MPHPPIVHAHDSSPGISRRALTDLSESDRKGLRLPRTTRYLTRYERGLIAFLERWDAGATPPLAA